jgi:hypothetical protein
MKRPAPPSDEVRALVRAELRALLARLVDDELPYSTHRDGPRPDGWSLRPWQVTAKRIPGAVRRGRYVIVPREAFRRWEAGTAVAPAPAANDQADVWSPGSALRAAGLRGTR